MTRLLVFLACLAAATGLLLWKSGGIEGPRARMSAPEVGVAPAPAAGSPLPLVGPDPSQPQLNVKDIGEAFYPRAEPRTFRDPRTGERVEIPHFVAWRFEARSGLPVSGAEAPEGAIVFEDVVVHAYREPRTLEEARRLRDDPRAIEGFVRLLLFARRARADGIAAVLRSRGGARPDTPDWTIRLEGDVRLQDLEEHVDMRGPALTFDPEAGRAEGEGPFTLDHEAWAIEGEALTVARDLRRRDVYRVDVGRHVFLELHQHPSAGLSGRGLDAGPGAFRPARVFAHRATLLHDETGGEQVHVMLEGDVRALQQGGRRLLADRLRLTAQASAGVRTSVGRAWTLVDLEAEGAPAVLEVDDLPARAGGEAEARLTARALRYECSPSGAETTMLEGDPVVLLRGELALPGLAGRGRWIRASARERAVLVEVDSVARAADGSAVAGRSLSLRGSARLERRGDAADPFQDVLEGDEIRLTLRPGASAGQEQPVAFAALGHVVLSGTRLAGETESLRVEGLDTLTPTVLADGRGTRLALLGLESGQRLLGPAPRAGEGADDPATPQRTGNAEVTWAVDRLDAAGRLAGETTLGGPTLGVPAWVEAERALYERVTGRTTLTGTPTEPASVRMDAGNGRQHALNAPTLSFESARGRLRAEGGAQAEVYVTPGDDRSWPGGPGGRSPASGRPATLTLTTDGTIELRFRLSRVGGEPEPGAPQVLHVPAPFTAEARTAVPELTDRLRADRLDMAFVASARDAPRSPSPLLARPSQRSAERTMPRRTAPEPAQRWRLSARTLTFDVVASRLDALEAEGGVVVDGDTLHAEGRTLAFDRPLGLLRLEGGPRARARFGAPESESTVEAQALRVLLDERGARALSAAGPVQAVLIEKAQAGAKRFEVDCQGDVQITRTELATVGAAETWLRSTERAPGESAWSRAAEVWAGHVVVRGRDLLSGGGRGGAGDPARRVDYVLAEGPSTAFASGSGPTRVEMWCQRIELAVPAGTATLTGAPGGTVRLRRGGKLESEFVRATFDLRTGAVHDVEATDLVLRQGR